jgi:hypothetical protein
MLIEVERMIKEDQGGKIEVEESKLREEYNLRLKVEQEDIKRRQQPEEELKNKYEEEIKKGKRKLREL